MTGIKTQAHLAKVCLDIFHAPNGGVIDLFGLGTADLREIRNYFSEVMGPIWCVELGLIPGLKMTDKVIFEQTSRDYDFKVYRGEDVFLVSNKRKFGVSNTLKPDAIITTIDNNPDLYKKWGSTKQYGVINILDDNIAVAGPVKAIAKYYPNLFSITPSEYSEVLRQLVRTDVVIDPCPQSIIDLVQNDTSASALYSELEQITGTMVNFLFEKALIAQSLRDSDYNELYIDVTEGNIYFLKFDLDRKGTMYCSIEKPQNSRQAGFRSKQGLSRRNSYGYLSLEKLGMTQTETTSRKYR